MKYKKDVSRECSLFSVKAWYEGESIELEKWIGFGFFNHLFLSEEGIVTLYYDVEEGDLFQEVLNKKLNTSFFDELCDYFFELINQIDDAGSDEEIFGLSVKMWPILSIFDEISKYPELGNENIIRRLIRVRKSTESEHYRLEKKGNHKNLPLNYIFYKDKVYTLPFKEFIKENGIEIVK